MHEGLISLTLLVDSIGDLKKAPSFISRGVFDDTDKDVIKDLTVIVKDSLKEFPEKIIECDDLLAKEMKKVLRKVIKNKWGSKPEIIVEVMRIEGCLKI